MGSPPKASPPLSERCAWDTMEANVDPLDRGWLAYLAAKANCNVKGCGEKGTCKRER